MNKVEKITYDLATPIVEQHNCYIYDIEYIKEGGLWYLRLYIDKEGGVGVDDCEAVSRGLSDILDQNDPISGNYYLEVSSPGIERKLTLPWHFEKYILQAVDVKLYKAIEGKKKYTGILKAYDGTSLVIEDNNKDVTIETENISLVKLHYEFGGI